MSAITSHSSFIHNNTHFSRCAHLWVFDKCMELGNHHQDNQAIEKRIMSVGGWVCSQAAGTYYCVYKQERVVVLPPRALCPFETPGKTIR